MDFIQTIMGQALEGLVLVGTAVEILIYFVPIVLGVLLFIVILSYRDDLKFKRVVYSRINEIDELSLAKLKIFIPTLLNIIGYLPVIEDEENEKITEETKKYAEEGDEPVESAEEQVKDQVAPQQKEEAQQQAPLKMAADAVVEKNGKRYAVMVEKKENGISPRIFNRLEKAMIDHDCENGIIINNGTFTPEELEQGELRSIEMWDRDRLIKELLKIQGKEDTRGQDIFFYVNDFFKWIVRG